MDFYMFGMIVGYVVNNVIKYIRTWDIHVITSTLH